MLDSSLWRGTTTEYFGGIASNSLTGSAQVPHFLLVEVAVRHKPYARSANRRGDLGVEERLELDLPLLLEPGRISLEFRVANPRMAHDFARALRKLLDQLAQRPAA